MDYRSRREDRQKEQTGTEWHGPDRRIHKERVARKIIDFIKSFHTSIILLTNDIHSLRKEIFDMKEIINKIREEK